MCTTKRFRLQGENTDIPNLNENLVHLLKIFAVTLSFGELIQI